MGMGKGPVMRSPPRGISGMTTSPSPAFFDFAPSHFHIESVASDKETKLAELEVLKLILIREGYVRHLGEVASQIMDGDRSVLRAAGGTFIVDLLVQTRASSLAVVRAIVSWRATLAHKVAEAAGVKKGRVTVEAISELSDKVREDVALARSQPFVWSGINYLLKMCNDTDFLADTLPLVQALGVDDQHMIHNPLMMPHTLDVCPRPNKQQRFEMEQGIGLGIPVGAGGELDSASTGKAAAAGGSGEEAVLADASGGNPPGASSESSGDPSSASSKTEARQSSSKTGEGPAVDANLKMAAGAHAAESSNQDASAASATAAAASANPGDEVLKLAWVLLAEERRARRAHRQERRKFEESERTSSRRRMRRSRRKDHHESDDGEDREESEDFYANDVSGPPKSQQGAPMDQQNESGPRGVHPSLESSPLRKGNSRVSSDVGDLRGHDMVVDEDDPYSGGGIREMAQMRPVLAWHEKARLLMRRWEEELRVRCVQCYCRLLPVFL